MTFTEQLQTLEDPRHPINIRHDFFDILFLTVSAILSQAEGWEDIEEFGKNKLEWLRKYYPFKNGIPSHDTISRVICLIPPDEFNPTTRPLSGRINQFLSTASIWCVNFRG